MRKVTSMTILTTAEGKRISLTYSEIDEYGNIVSDNQRVNRVLVDEDVLQNVSKLEEFAQKIADSEK